MWSWRRSRGVVESSDVESGDDVKEGTIKREAATMESLIANH